MEPGTRVKPSASYPMMGPYAKPRTEGTYLRKKAGSDPHIIVVKWDGLDSREYIHEDFVEPIDDKV